LHREKIPRTRLSFTAALQLWFVVLKFVRFFIISENIKFICNGKKIQDDHCHIHLCLVAWTQLPLCGIIFVAFFLGASWELYDYIRLNIASRIKLPISFRRSRRARIGRSIKIENLFLKEYRILPEDGEIKTVPPRHNCSE